MFPVIVFYFILIVNSSVLATHTKRSWDANAWSNHCVLPPCPEHASYEVTGLEETWQGERWPTVVEFTCWPGYTLVGSRVIECYDGRWSDRTPQCVDYRGSGENRENYQFTNNQRPQYAWADAHVFTTQNPHQQQFLPQWQQLETQQQHPQSQKIPPQTQQIVPQPQGLAIQPQGLVQQPQELISKPQELVSQPQEFVTQPQELVPQPQGLVTQPQELVSQPQELVSQPQEFVTQPQKFVTQPQELVPQLQGLVTQPQELVSKPQELMTQPQELVSQPQELVPQPQELVTQLQELVSKPQELVSQPQELVSQPQEFVSQPQSLVPQSQPLTSQQQASISKPQQLIPQLKEPNITTAAPESGCKLPPTPTNGSYEVIEMMNTSSIINNVSSSVKLQFTCNSGNRLQGASAVVCVEGRWSDPFPECVFLSSESTPKEEQPSTQRVQTKGSCYVPGYPRNGLFGRADENTDTVLPGQVLVSVNLKFWCYRGYNLVGAELVNCSEGKWSDKFPRCENNWAKSGQTYGGALRTSTMRIDVCDSCPRSCMLQTVASSSSASNKFGPNFIAECGVLQVTRRYKFEHTGVAGGRPAIGSWKITGNELPWHVGIYDKTSTPFTQICGGSIISPSLVVSAAHCFWDDLEKQLPASQYAVGAGKRYRLWDEERDGFTQKTDVKEIKIPPRYQHSMTNFQEDLALVTVLNAFTFDPYVLPVCIDFNFQLDVMQLQAGKLGKVGGWGLTAENGKPAPLLQIAEMPYVAIDTCIAKNEPGFLSYLTGDKLCAGYKNGTAVCKGDSGGGLVYPEDDNGTKRYYLRGVVSAAPVSPNDCNVYAWATFTHVLRHEHFITPLLTS